LLERRPSAERVEVWSVASWCRRGRGGRFASTHPVHIMADDFLTILTRMSRRHGGIV
jgi:hypothetical protein